MKNNHSPWPLGLGLFVGAIEPSMIVAIAAFRLWSDPMGIILIVLAALIVLVYVAECSIEMYMHSIAARDPDAVPDVDDDLKDRRDKFCKWGVWLSMPLCAALLYLTYATGPTGWGIFLDGLAATNVILAICLWVTHRKAQPR